MKVKKLKLSDEAKARLSVLFLGLDSNPYHQYKEFRHEISYYLAENQVPESFLQICESIKDDRKSGATYAHLIQNCPIDFDIPLFNHADPLNDKYAKKQTYIGESFLELLAQLTDAPPLAYDTRNNGDFFHDVYAHAKYSNTQTQKTDSELFYHNDRTAHEIRADYLALLGMRSYENNKIYTGYIDGRALLENLTEIEQEILRNSYFITPFDDYSKDSNENQVSSDIHSILEDFQNFRYYDTRTTYAPNAPIEAREALLSLKDAIMKAQKDHIQIKAGELFVFPNQAGLHNREIIEVADSQEAKDRWILKTYNFKNTETQEKHLSSFHEDLPGLVKETVLVPQHA